MAVTYTILNRDHLASGKELVVATIAYAAEPYSSGVPVDKASLACPSSLDSFVIVDPVNSTTDIYKFDAANAKVRRYVEGAGTYAETSGNQTFTVTVMAKGW